MRRTMIAAMVVVVLAACGSPDPVATLPTGVIVTEAPRPTAAPAPTEAPAPTQTLAPTNTPAPTETPAPTTTPAPTATPSPIPATATPVLPVLITGKGQTVTDPFTPPAKINRVTFTHQGRRNFIVQV